jgi:hypothetical protein
MYEETGMNSVFSAMSCTVDGFLADKGVQFVHNDRRVAVGAICMRHSLEWRRPINLTPTDPYWQDLYFAALLEQGAGTLSVVTGCPHSMLGSFRGCIPKGKFTFQTRDGRREIEVLNASVMPECAGHALAFSRAFKGECIVVSLGFGTVELGASNEEGIIDRSLDSVTYGLHHCSSPMRAVLEQKGVDCSHARLDQHFYFDDVLRRAYVKDENLNFINRNGQTLDYSHFHAAVIDILERYARDLVPRIRQYFQRFSDRMPVVITGGGVNYGPVRDILLDMFQKMRYTATVAPQDVSLVSAATGYKIAAEAKYGHGVPVAGIDIGNHNCVVKWGTK